MTDYLNSPTECIFCDIVSERKPSHRIYEDEHVLVFISLEGHPLVVPKPHFKDIVDLDVIHAAAIMKIAVRVAQATMLAMPCDGINLIQSNGAAAGQDVFHFHLHIKPRFADDDVIIGWDTRTIEDKIRGERSRDILRHLSMRF